MGRTCARNHVLYPHTQRQWHVLPNKHTDFSSDCSVKGEREREKFNLFLKVTTLNDSHTHRTHVYSFTKRRTSKKSLSHVCVWMWQIKCWGKRWHSSEKVSHIGLKWCNLNLLLNEISSEKERFCVFVFVPFLVMGERIPCDLFTSIWCDWCHE